MIQNAEVEEFSYQIEENRSRSEIEGLTIFGSGKEGLITGKSILKNNGSILYQREASLFKESALSRFMTKADIPTSTQKRMVFDYDAEENEYVIESFDHETVAKMLHLDPNRVKYTLLQISKLCPMKKRIIPFKILVNLGAAIFLTVFLYSCFWMVALFVLNPLIMALALFWIFYYLLPGMRLKLEGWKIERKCKQLKKFLIQENNDYYLEKKAEWRIGRFGMWVEVVSLAPKTKMPKYHQVVNP